MNSVTELNRITFLMTDTYAKESSVVTLETYN